MRIGNIVIVNVADIGRYFYCARVVGVKGDSIVVDWMVKNGNYPLEAIDTNAVRKSGEKVVYGIVPLGNVSSARFDARLSEEFVKQLLTPPEAVKEFRKGDNALILMEVGIDGHSVYFPAKVVEAVGVKNPTILVDWEDAKEPNISKYDLSNKKDFNLVVGKIRGGPRFVWGKAVLEENVKRMLASGLA